MPTSLNVVLQFVALLVAAAIRMHLPGWTLILMFAFAYPIVGAMLPIALALGTARRKRLSWTVAVPFGASAVGLVAAAGVLPEYGSDQAWWVPATVILGVPRPHVDMVELIGNVAVLGYVAVLVWLVAAIIMTHRPRVTPTEPPPSVGSA
jgi:hypothetical protein